MTKREFAKRLAIIILTGTAILFVLTVVIAASTGYYLYSQVLVFSEHSGISFSEMKALAKTAWDKPVDASGDYKNILILGVDSLENRGDAPPLTDTIMVASIHIPSGQINTLSLPRDLWSEDYLTKINALYYYGDEHYPETPERFTEETVEELLNVPLHHTVVLSMDALASLIDLLGGIEVDVPRAFTDDEFPRTDVDVTVERDPAKLYKTVSFEQGKQLMSGEKALEYIRSRHSDDDQGHDLARTERQQLVINSLLNKVNDPATLTNPALLGDLYRHYQKNYEKYLPIVEVGALLKALLPVKNAIELNPHTLSVYPDDEAGVLWHPPIWETQNQWVYSVRDQELFENEAAAALQAN